MQQDRSRQMHEEIGMGLVQAVVDDFYARIHPGLASMSEFHAAKVAPDPVEQP
ncbi:hypothetical protein [Thermithiobacillus plumbiphilus]|uniref:Globin n=1 Tax=Thermithiobacillus plumbiphilus TaxID=1729899 RepID=A0ABU9D856_9PROT